MTEDERQLKVLWVSAFDPDSLESAASRLRKLTKGLESANVSVDWVYPPKHPISSNGFKKIFIRITDICFMSRDALRWLKQNSKGVAIFSFPPAWLLGSSLIVSILKPRRSVLDFRDPLVAEKLIPRSKLMNFLIHKLQTLALLQVSKVTVASPAIASFLNVGEKVHPVLSGFDPADLSSNLRAESAKLEGEFIHYVYGGTFYGSRSPIALIHALGELKQSCPTMNARFSFFCRFNEAIGEAVARNLISKLSLEENVKIFPMLSAENFKREINNADILIVITHSEGSEYAIPGKIFDYIAAQKPVLLLSQDTVLLSLMKDYDLPVLTSANTVEMIFPLLTQIQEAQKTAKVYGGDFRKREILSCIYQGKLLRNILFGSYGE